MPTPLPRPRKGPSLFRLNLSSTCPTSYLQLGTIKEEITTEGCQRRKLRRPSHFAVHNAPQTHHKRTTKHHVPHTKIPAVHHAGHFRPGPTAANPHKTSILGATHIDAIF